MKSLPLRQVTFVTRATKGKFPPARIPTQKRRGGQGTKPGGSVRRLLCILVKIFKIASCESCAKRPRTRPEPEWQDHNSERSTYPIGQEAPAAHPKAASPNRLETRRSRQSAVCSESCRRSFPVSHCGSIGISSRLVASTCGRNLDFIDQTGAGSPGNLRKNPDRMLLLGHLGESPRKPMAKLVRVWRGFEKIARRPLVARHPGPYNKRVLD
jgi:hypothetical protein